MIIFLLLSVLIIYFAFINFKKTFLFYLALKMIGLSMMCIKYSSPALSMETLLNFFFIFEFFRRGLIKKILNRFYDFPLKKYFLISLFSIFVSLINSIMPITSNLNSLLLTLLDDYLLVIIFWFYINDSKDIKQYLQYCILVLIITYLYGMLEFISNSNPVLDYIKNNVPENLLEGKFYETGERLGLRRINSLFISPNNFIYGSFIATLIFYFNKYYKNKIKHSILFLYATGLMVLLANSRTVLISSLIMFIPLVLFYKKKSYGIIISMIVIFIIASPFLMQYVANITSVLMPSEKSQIEGSSVDGRMIQFLGSLELMMQSPFTGNGIGSISYFVSEEGGWKWIILGTESIWMKLMIERGLLGIVSYIFLFYDLVKKFGITQDSTLFFVTAGYLLAHTMSSLPGFSMSFFMILIFCFYKLKINSYAYRNLNHTPSL